MDINIFTGDNYGSDSNIISDLLINIAGSFLGIIGAYGIYLLQTKNEKANKLKIEIEQLREHAEFIKNLIKDIVTNQLSQQEHYKTYCEALKNNPTKPEKLTVITNYDIKRLLKLENEITFKSFKKIYVGTAKDLYKNYKNLFTCIFFLNELNDQAKEIYSKQIITIIGNLEEQYKTTTQDIANYLGIALKTIKHQNLATYRTLPEYNILNNLLGIYHTIVATPTELTTIQNNFIDPLKKIIVEEYPYEEYSNYLMSNCKNASVYINDIKHYCLTFAEYYENAHAKSKEKTEKLTELNKLFEIKNGL